MNLDDLTANCRVCMIEIDAQKSSAVSVFKKTNGIVFASFLAESFKLKILKNDGLPQSVCSNCVKNIDIANALKNLAVSSDFKLRQLVCQASELSQPKSEPIDAETTDELNLERNDTQQRISVSLVKDEQPVLEAKPTSEIKATTNKKVKHTRKTQLANHRIPKRGDIYCCMCVNYFNTKIELMDHAQIHDRTAPETLKTDGQIDCKICLRRYQNYKGYRLHLKRKYMQRKRKDYICRICGKVFSTHTSLMYCERKHEGKLPKLECALCNLVSNSRSNLIAHMEIHRGVKNFACEICGTRFRMLNNMQKHLLTHTMERPHSCSICKKTFARTSSLTVHMRVHTGERPFSCKYCEKTFIHTSDCRRHEMSHTGVRPYTCSFCDKSFKTGTLLRVHLPVHTGVKPFKCNVCSIEYYQKKSLNRHMREKHALAIDESQEDTRAANNVTVIYSSA